MGAGSGAMSSLDIVPVGPDKSGRQRTIGLFPQWSGKTHETEVGKQPWNLKSKALAEKYTAWTEVRRS